MVKRKYFTYLNIILINFLIIISVIIWYSYFAIHDDNYSSIKKVIIVKLPRSGSSWITEKLNSIPNIYISKEIIQHKDVVKYSNRDVEDHMITALTKPTGKISDSRSILPGSRMFKDYYFHKSLKIFSDLKVLGVSINLEHVENINWLRIRNFVPNLTMVVLYRINVIKSAISGFSGQLLHSSCGVSNIRKTTIGNFYPGKCNVTSILNSKVDWNRETFVIEINKWMTRYKRFWARIKMNENLKDLRMQYVSYEEMQLNVTNTISELLQLFGITSNNKIISYISSDSSLVKRTNENLRNVLLNYDDIHTALSKHKECTCLLAQLNSTGPKDTLPCEEQLLTYISATNDITCS